MVKDTPGVCRTEQCSNNTVFGRKYCNNCEQKRKEKKGKRLAIGGGTGLGLTGLAAMALKHKDSVPTIAVTLGARAQKVLRIAISRLR